MRITEKKRQSLNTKLNKTPRWTQDKVYLVWACKKRGLGVAPDNIDLRAVCSFKLLAEMYEANILIDEKDILWTWVEERDTNHCYGLRDIALGARRGVIPFHLRSE